MFNNEEATPVKTMRQLRPKCAMRERGGTAGIGGQVAPMVQRSSLGSELRIKPVKLGRAPASDHTNSIFSERPTMRAARCNVDNVTLPSFGSSNRPI